MPIKKLSESIRGLEKHPTLGAMFLLGKIQNKWEEIVGKDVYNATAVLNIKEKRIYIKCKNPTWKNELFYQKKQILKKIKQQTSDIEEIIFI